MDFRIYLKFNISLECVMWKAELNSRDTIFMISGQFVYFAADMDVIGEKIETFAETRSNKHRTSG